MNDVALEKFKNYKIKKAELEYVGFSNGQQNSKMKEFIEKILKSTKQEKWEDTYSLVKETNKKNNPPIEETELRNIFQDACSSEVQISKGVMEKILVKRNYRQRYTWGTPTLDNSFSIIKRNNFIVLGAKSGMGKTSYCFDMAIKNCALGHKVLFLSLEMDEKEIVEMFARLKAGITIEEEREYKIPESKQIVFDERVKEIKNIKNLFFRSVRRGGKLGWKDLRKIICDYEELDLVFIDNLDLIDGEPRENEWDRQKRVTGEIMGFTSEKQVPIILIHHYRKTMGKTSKVANEDDLSGSKKIFDNADRVLNISRNKEVDAKYPEKYKSTIMLQKGREYSDSLKYIYFIRGAFMDTPPSFRDYYGEDDQPNEKWYETEKEEIIVVNEEEENKQGQLI